VLRLVGLVLALTAPLAASIALAAPASAGDSNCFTPTVGPFPTEEALDFHLQQIPPDLDVEWVLVPYALDDPALVERLCRHALARGGGIRLGIGDDPEAFPESTNAALVERAARWVAEAGRPLASPADVRRRFGLEATPGRRGDR